MPPSSSQPSALRHQPTRSRTPRRSKCGCDANTQWANLGEYTPINHVSARPKRQYYQRSSRWPGGQGCCAELLEITMFETATLRASARDIIEAHEDTNIKSYLAMISDLLACLRMIKSQGLPGPEAPSTHAAHHFGCVHPADEPDCCCLLHDTFRIDPVRHPELQHHQQKSKTLLPQNVSPRPKDPRPHTRPWQLTSNRMQVICRAARGCRAPGYLPRPVLEQQWSPMGGFAHSMIAAVWPLWTAAYAK